MSWLQSGTRSSLDQPITANNTERMSDSDAVEPAVKRSGTAPPSAAPAPGSSCDDEKGGLDPFPWVFPYI